MSNEEKLAISIDAIDFYHYEAQGTSIIKQGEGLTAKYIQVTFTHIPLDQEERAELDALRRKIAERYRRIMKDKL